MSESRDKMLRRLGYTPAPAPEAPPVSASREAAARDLAALASRAEALADIAALTAGHDPYESEARRRMRARLRGDVAPAECARADSSTITRYVRD